MRENVNFRVLGSKRVRLDQRNTKMFELGDYFAKLIQLIVDDKVKEEGFENVLGYGNKMKSLKHSFTPPGRLYNWNIIQEALEKLDIIVDNDVKSLIVARDNDMIDEVLKQIYDKYKP